MKKTLSFEKDLTFQTMIGEITTISFEEDLKFVDKSDIEGNFYVSGKYKMTEASTLLEDFSFSIPTQIAMIENYDLETTKISVENFTYEIVDDDILRCKIDILIEGREEVVLEEEKEEVMKEELVSEEMIEENKKEEPEVLEELVRNQEERECDGDPKADKEQELPIKEEPVNIEGSLKEESTMKEEREETVTQEEEVMEQEEVTEKKDETPSIKVNSLFANMGDGNDTFTTYSVYIMREGDTVEKVMDQYQVKREDLEVYNDLSTIELNSKVIIPSFNHE